MAIPLSRRLDFTEIPVIDMSSLMAGEDDSNTISAIGKACREVGFISVSYTHLTLPTIYSV